MLEPLLVKGRPHWEVNHSPEVAPFYEDFRVFLAAVWKHLGLPDPTPAQYEIAHRLQYGADTVEWGELESAAQESLYWNPREDVIRCFRSLGKSYITSAFVIWRLMRNPRDEKVLVVSAAGSKAKEFVSQTKSILTTLSLTKWMMTGTRERGADRRDMADQFDVCGSSLSQSYSVAARGVTGQLTGSRSTLLIADDIEVEKNSLTEDARARLIRIVESDFIPITKTEHGKGDIIFLGTPQTEESVYNVLVKEKGFRCLCIPVRYPTMDKMNSYIMSSELTGGEINILARYLRMANESGDLPHGKPTDTRFGHDELLAIESKGRSTFALQYMLDTTLSDAERYPLRQQDLIVFSTSPLKAPLSVQWGRHNDKKNSVKGIPNVGFSGDHFLRPLFVDSEWTYYDQKLLYVDPSGRGKDETAWAICGSLNGIIYALHVDGFAGDPSEAMSRIAVDAKKYDVRKILVEPNYGQGMWTAAFYPVINNIWPGGVKVDEDVWASGQKEARIIDTLEPVMTQHRLVIDEQLVEREARAAEAKFSLMYQLTHLTRDRGSLKHDDRLDALSGAVRYFTRNMSQDIAVAAQSVRDAAMEAEIEDFMEGLESGGLSRKRGVRRNGVRKENHQWSLAL